MSPANIIRELLMDLDSGQWTIFVSFLPGVPDEAICIYDTAGKIDGRLMSTGETIEHPGIQIRVRGRDYEGTWEKVVSIVKILDSIKRIPVVFSEEEAYIVHSVSRHGAVIPLGIDETDNHRHYHFTANMTVTLSLQP